MAVFDAEGPDNDVDGLSDSYSFGSQSAIVSCCCNSELWVDHWLDIEGSKAGIQAVGVSIIFGTLQNL